MIWVISRGTGGLLLDQWNYPALLAHYKFKIRTSRNFDLHSEETAGPTVQSLLPRVSAP